MNNYLEAYLKDVQAEGKLYFTLDEIKKRFELKSEEALKLSLNRLSKKIESYQ